MDHQNKLNDKGFPVQPPGRSLRLFGRRRRKDAPRACITNLPAFFVAKWQSLWVAGITALLLFLLTAPSVLCQQVPISLSVPAEPVQIAAEPVDFDDRTRLVRIRDEQGRLVSRQTNACIEIRAPENIPVLVMVELKGMVQRRDGRWPAAVEPRYINDGGQCPADHTLAMDISHPFNKVKKAFFTLNEQPKLIRNFPEKPPRLSCHLYLVVFQLLMPDISLGVPPSADKNNEHLLIDIEYL